MGFNHEITNNLDSNVTVLLLSPLPPPNGGIAQWTETVKEYCKKESNINLYHLNTGSNTKDVINRSFYERYIRQFIKIFDTLNRIKKLLMSDHIDVAHITTSGDYGVLRDLILSSYLCRRKVPYIYHMHFGTFNVLKEKKDIRYVIMEKVIEKATIIITMDPTTMASLDNKKAVFLPNPIKRNKYSPSIEKRVIFLGYIVKQKGVEELLEAWNKVSKDFPDWKLIMVGPYDNDYMENLYSLIKVDSVIFTGEKSHEEAMDYLNDSAVLALPSYHEGFPYSVCEAMFSGKAIVASDVGAIPYMLSDDCGVLCKKEDVESLELAIRKVLSDSYLREKIGYNAALKARNEFSQEVVLEKLYKIWRDCK